ncbi:Type IV secretory pathway, VirB4 components [Pseudomonas aeruginosa]|nr:Type IV secretory pathway, VirB4 components [Pseudomonas aeruginosa]
MSQANELLIGAGPDGQPVGQAWRLANRHGLIAGATGTGKTVTLQHLAESFSDAGVAVFAADIRATCAASPRRATRRARSPNVSPACRG